MPYAEGDGWSVDIIRSPQSGGFAVYVEEMDWRANPPVKRTRIAGNRFGYARRETAERRAEREAERLWGDN